MRPLYRGITRPGTQQHDESLGSCTYIASAAEAARLKLLCHAGVLANEVYLGKGPDGLEGHGDRSGRVPGEPYQMAVHWHLVNDAPKNGQCVT